ncbi:MAG: PEP-CTERM sorting domain-containing protein [Bacteroidetes bacterium]|nr:MAG: PEP-CTERM sorting domain-containing protein [Bacteroidota bacterium]
MKFVFTICILMLSSMAKSQLIVENYLPYSTINSDFLGSNYQISNVSYTGSLYACGMFDGTSSNIGLTHGIVLTTGTVIHDTLHPNGPQGPNNAGGSGIDNGTSGYIPLSNLVGGTTTYNAAVIEFDFIPTVDSIGLTYVFGSEEYTEYVGSQFTDVFAIFISGPGIFGAPNIAKTPNGNPVSIQTINYNSNSSLYIDNGNGQNAPYNADPYYIQYDGFTVPLVASQTGLQPGQTYHITIAIADVGDGILDSGLFIEKCSGCGFQLGTSDINTSPPKLVGIYDLMGRKIDASSNQVQLHYYSDGSTKLIYPTNN